MSNLPTGPACGNNPNYRMSDGDRRAVDDFRAFLEKRAALLDRITTALAVADGWQFSGSSLNDLPERELRRYRDNAAAVLAVLPPSVSRADVLREAADIVGNDDTCDCGGCDSCVPNARAAELRRLADEAQLHTEAHAPTHTWKVESPRRDQWASWGTDYDQREWALERYESALSTAPQRPFRLVRASTTYTVEAEHTPAAGEQS